MKRKLIQALNQWKTKANRKPLILQGARQVGKTFLLKEFGKSSFPQCHYFNFEKETELATIFQLDLDPQRIINELSFRINKPIMVEEDLVIFDEIQMCPQALTSLKYFQEEMPQLALCSAGSLLGVHLNHGSFPVGKVEFIKMFPMTFMEFLQGVGDEKSVSFLTAFDGSYIPSIVHQHLWDQFKLYLVVGGLPEVIDIYRKNQDNLFNALLNVRIKQNDLIKSYYVDMAKHSGKINAMHIDRLWRAIPRQLARNEEGNASKFKFKDIIPGIDRYSRLVNVIDWLDAAGLIIKVYIVEKAHLPLMAYTKENSFKLLMFDVGILGAMSDLSPKVILDYNYGTYKGYFAENIVAQELLAASGVNQLYCWQEGTAEIEFLLDCDGNIIPIEVKSGHVTQAKSLKVFAQKYQPKNQIIMSANNLTLDTNRHVFCYPLYLVSQMYEKAISQFS